MKNLFLSLVYLWLSVLGFAIQAQVALRPPFIDVKVSHDFICVIDSEGAKCWPALYSRGENKLISDKQDPMGDNICDVSDDKTSSCIYKLPISNPNKISTTNGRVCASNEISMVCAGFTTGIGWTYERPVPVKNVRSLKVLAMPYSWHATPCLLDDYGARCMSGQVEFQIKGADNPSFLLAEEGLIDGGIVKGFKMSGHPVPAGAQVYGNRDYVDEYGSGSGSLISMALEKLFPSGYSVGTDIKLFSESFGYIVSKENQIFKFSDETDQISRTLKFEPVKFRKLQNPTQIVSSDSFFCVLDQGKVLCGGDKNSKVDIKVPPMANVQKLDMSFSSFEVVGKGYDGLPENQVGYSYLACAIYDSGYNLSCWRPKPKNITASPRNKTAVFLPKILKPEGKCQAKVGSRCWDDIVQKLSSPDLEQSGEFLKEFSKYMSANPSAYLKALAIYQSEIYKMSSQAKAFHYSLLKRAFSDSNSEFYTQVLLPILDSRSRLRPSKTVSEETQSEITQVALFHLIAILRQAGDIPSTGSKPAIGINELVRSLVVQKNRQDAIYLKQILEKLELLTPYFDALKDAAELQSLLDVFQECKRILSERLKRE